MANHYIIPSATVGNPLVGGSGWSANGAASIHECIDDGAGSNDDDTTYISDGDSGGNDVGVSGNTDFPDNVSVINSVLIGGYHRTAIEGFSPEGTNHLLYINSTRYTSAITLGTGIDTYALKTTSWATNPDTTNPWLESEIDAPLVFGLRRTNTNGPAWYTSSLWVDVDFEPARGGFVIMMSAILPWLGAGLGLEHLPAIARAVCARTRTLISPREYARALDELRGMKRAAFA